MMILMRRLGQLLKLQTKDAVPQPAAPNAPSTTDLLGPGLRDLRKGHFDKAWGQWRRLLEVAPDPEATGIAAIRFLFREGAHRQAIEAVHRTLDRLRFPFNLLQKLEAMLPPDPLGPEYNELFSRIRAMNPAFAALRTRLAAHAYRQGRYDDAGKDYDALVFLGTQDAFSWCESGLWALRRHQFFDAMRRLEHAYILDPSSPRIQFGIGYVSLRAGKLAQAIECFEKASRQNPIPAETWYYLGMIHHIRGDREHAREAWTRHAETLGSDRLALHYFHSMLTTVGQFELAQQVWDRYRQKPDSLPNLSPHEPIVLLSVWTCSTCRLGVLDVWLKSLLLAHPSASPRPIIRVSPDNIANQFYLSCWSRWFVVETVKSRADPIASPIPEEELRFFPPLALPAAAGASAIPFGKVVGAVQQAWERQNRPLLPELPEDVRRWGRDALVNLGVSPGQWFATIFVRSADSQRTDLGLDHTNASVERYLPAVKAIVDRGGKVIRLGSAQSEPFPACPGLIDYALSPHQCEWMDVFLAAEGEFHIGMPIGDSHIPATFGKPTLFTNCWNWASLPWFGRDLVLPKLFRSKLTGAVLPLTEILGSALEQPLYSYFFTSQGLEWVDNSAEDLRDAALEMLDRVRGPVQASSKRSQKKQKNARSASGAAARLEAEDVRQTRINELLAKHGIVMNCRLPQGFLNRHFDTLMPSAVLRKQAA